MPALTIPTGNDLERVFPGYLSGGREILDGIISAPILDGDGSNPPPGWGNGSTAALVTEDVKSALGDWATLTQHRHDHATRLVIWLVILEYSQSWHLSQIQDSTCEKPEDFKRRKMGYCNKARRHMKALGIRVPGYCEFDIDAISTGVEQHCEPDTTT